MVIVVVVVIVVLLVVVVLIVVIVLVGGPQPADDHSGRGQVRSRRDGDSRQQLRPRQQY